MAVVAGIDEAGYGPRLGPLVISAAAFEVPDQAADQCLWTRLDAVVTRSRRDRARIAVDDSKRLFSQATGVRHIERTALAFAAAAGQEATTFQGLLTGLAEGADGLAAYPWYEGADCPVPLAADAGQVGPDARRLQETPAARFLGVRSIPVLVGEYNRLVDQVGTKSATLFLKNAQLLTELWRDWGDRGLIVHVDKHGGRNAYGLLLHQTFFGARIATLAEGRDHSLYDVRDGRRRMTIGFYMNGDARHLPIALASIYSKYLRELFMHHFNAFWTARLPGLKPTAGYAADANRFLADTQEARQRLAIDERLLIRIA